MQFLHALKQLHARIAHVTIALVATTHDFYGLPCLAIEQFGYLKIKMTLDKSLSANCDSFRHDLVANWKASQFAIDAKRVNFCPTTVYV